MLHPTLGYWSADGAWPARTASAAATRSAPVIGWPFPGRESSNWVSIGEPPVGVEEEQVRVQAALYARVTSWDSSYRYGKG